MKKMTLEKFWMKRNIKYKNFIKLWNKRNKKNKSLKTHGRKTSKKKINSLKQWKKRN